jgi:uncharacterized protein YraI
MARKKQTEAVAETAETKNQPENTESVSEPETGGANIAAAVLDGIEGDLAAVTARNGLNLRAGPALSYPVLEVLPEGAVVKALALPYGVEVPGWALVHTGNLCGWARVEFLAGLEE